MMALDLRDSINITSFQKEDNFGAALGKPKKGGFSDHPSSLRCVIGIHPFCGPNISSYHKPEGFESPVFL